MGDLDNHPELTPGYGVIPTTLLDLSRNHARKLVEVVGDFVQHVTEIGNALFRRDKCHRVRAVREQRFAEIKKLNDAGMRDPREIMKALLEICPELVKKTNKSRDGKKQ